MSRGDAIHSLSCRLLFSVYSVADVGVSLCVHGWESLAAGLSVDAK